jgi:hypothetical protein
MNPNTTVAARNSPRTDNRDLTGKYVLKGPVKAGFSRPKDALSATTKITQLLKYVAEK